MLRSSNYEDYDIPVDVEAAAEPGIVLRVRFTADEADRLSDAAEARHLLITELAHDLILEALDAPRMKSSAR